MAFDLSGQSTVVVFAVFAAAAAVVWAAGSRLSTHVDALARRLELGPAFAGMLLMGGITSLPEAATVATAAARGDGPLAINNLIGSAAINVLLLAVADAAFGRGALTGVVAKPATLMQGVLGMMLLAGVAMVVVAGETAVAGVGVGSLALALGAFGAMRVSAGFERREVWRPAKDPPQAPEEQDAARSLRRIVPALLLLAAAILAGGVVLSQAADGIAARTGLASGLIGFVLVAFATSLPELSSVLGAVRARRYELAVGDIFGTNLFNLSLFLLADLIADGEPVLAGAGPFEAVGALAALLMTGAFTVGLLERRDAAVLRMGYDALASVVVFAVALAVMTRLAD